MTADKRTANMSESMRAWRMLVLRQAAMRGQDAKAAAIRAELLRVQ